MYSSKFKTRIQEFTQFKAWKKLLPWRPRLLHSAGLIMKFSRKITSIYDWAEINFVNSYPRQMEFLAWSIKLCDISEWNWYCKPSFWLNHMGQNLTEWLTWSWCAVRYAMFPFSFIWDYNEILSSIYDWDKIKFINTYPWLIEILVLRLVYVLSVALPDFSDRNCYWQLVFSTNHICHELSGTA